MAPGRPNYIYARRFAPTKSKRIRKFEKNELAIAPFQMSISKPELPRSLAHSLRETATKIRIKIVRVWGCAKNSISSRPYKRFRGLEIND